MLDSYFKLSENGVTIRTEVLAGVTTFLTMAYIIFVNPLILADAGMDRDAVFMATCLAAAIGTLIMGLYANYPIALAPGMGLNAYFTYGVVLGMGFTWQVALGAVFISGVLFLLLSIFRTREWIINAIPKSLKLSVSAGIGMFLAIIALKNAFPHLMGSSRRRLASLIIRRHDRRCRDVYNGQGPDSFVVDQATRPVTVGRPH